MVSWLVAPKAIPEEMRPRIELAEFHLEASAAENAARMPSLGGNAATARPTTVTDVPPVVTALTRTIVLIPAPSESTLNTAV
jgi:xanthine dehydrogenase iron-sulfur cluster and FAD-binding subunit A